MIREIKLARERVAEQSHPHESRAKAFEETRAGYISQDHSDVVDNGGIVNICRKKRNDGHNSNAGSVRWELALDEKRRHTTANVNRELYECRESDLVSQDKTESCPFGCDYRSADVSLVKAHLNRYPNKDQSFSVETADISSSSQNNFAKNLVQSFQRNVKAGLDDNLNLLCNARFWPLPSSSKAIYASMPSKAEPVRYNYNSNEWGLTINNHNVIIALHDRTITSVTLNMFTDNALAKHEVNRSWKPGKDGIKMVTKDEFDEIIKVPVSLNALNNFRCIYQKIWPLDTSVDALFNATWRQLGSSAYPPTAGDISELFAYWIQDRAQAAVEGRPPQTFVNLSSHLNTICQRRQPSESENNIFLEKGSSLTEKPKQGFKAARKGTERFRRYNNEPGREPYSRQSSQGPGTCILFNSIDGCPMQVPAGGTCVNRFGKRFLHLCNFFDNNKGAMCKGPHSVMNHR